MTKTRKIFGFIIWVIFIAIICVVALYLLLVANGYKVNAKTWEFEKTGMIYIKSNPKDSTVYVNGEQISEKTPLRYGEILPKRYEVKVSKYDYNDWNKTFNVESGMVSSADYVELFLVNPKELEVHEQEQLGFDLLLEQWPAKGLEIKLGAEIWFNDVLVTRFSSEVKYVNWYFDRKHILFQIRDEIRVMDPDGSNNIKLVDLSSDFPSEFMPYDEGKSLLYKDGKEIKKVIIK